MKNRLFSPIIIVLGLAILLVSAFVTFRPQEEKIIKKVHFSSNRLQKILEKRKEQKNQQNNPEVSGSELLTAERVYTEAEIQNITEVQFVEMLKETENKLPTLGDIKQLPSGALHHIPSIVLEAGRNLGVLKEVFKYHPEFEEKSISFYTQCAHAENRPTTVRALCLTNLIEISRRRNLPLELTSFPSNIVELTKLVTDM